MLLSQTFLLKVKQVQDELKEELDQQLLDIPIKEELIEIEPMVVEEPPEPKKVEKKKPIPKAKPMDPKIFTAGSSRTVKRLSRVEKYEFGNPYAYTLKYDPNNYKVEAIFARELAGTFTDLVEKLKVGDLDLNPDGSLSESALARLEPLAWIHYKWVCAKCDEEFETSDLWRMFSSL
jgi:hypothetical protein